MQAKLGRLEAWSTLLEQLWRIVIYSQWNLLGESRIGTAAPLFFSRCVLSHRSMLMLQWKVVRVNCRPIRKFRIACLKWSCKVFCPCGCILVHLDEYSLSSIRSCHGGCLVPCFVLLFFLLDCCNWRQAFTFTTTIASQPTS